MPFNNRCKNCQEKTLHYSRCDFNCTKKGEVKIYPEKITQKSIKECLENNIGCSISQASMSQYYREILRVIN